MHRIMIVDDERPARDFITELVSSYLPDSKVVHAENTDKALACITAENFDLLFVDIEMPPPHMNGLELLAKINRMGKFPFTILRYIPKPLPKGEPDPVYYISKPLYDERIFEAIRFYLSKVASETVDLKIYNGIRRVAINQIHAIETAGRGKVNVYTSDTLLKDVSKSLCQLHDRLYRRGFMCPVDTQSPARIPSCFLYIRRNCIINLHAIKHYIPKSREVIIDCQGREYSFTVSRENMKKLAALLSSKNI